MLRSEEHTFPHKGGLENHVHYVTDGRLKAASFVTFRILLLTGSSHIAHWYTSLLLHHLRYRQSHSNPPWPKEMAVIPAYYFRDTFLWRSQHIHMHMIWQRCCLYDCDYLHLAYFTDGFAHFQSQGSEHHFPPIFWNESDMIPAIIATM